MGRLDRDGTGLSLRSSRLGGWLWMTPHLWEDRENDSVLLQSVGSFFTKLLILSLSLYTYLSLSLSLSVRLCVCVSPFLSFDLPSLIYPSLYLSIYFSVSLPLSVYVCLSLSFSLIFPSLPLSPYLSVFLSLVVYPSLFVLSCRHVIVSYLRILSHIGV